MLLSEAAAIASRAGRSFHCSAEKAHAVFAQACGQACDRLRSAAAERASNSGRMLTLRVAIDHADLTMFRIANSVMLGRDAEESASQRGPCGMLRVANAHDIAERPGASNATRSRMLAIAADEIAARRVPFA